MKLLTEKYPQLKQNYINYQNIVTNATEDDYKNRTFNKVLYKIYGNFNTFAREINFGIKDLFELSIPFYDENETIISAELRGYQRYTTVYRFTLQMNASMIKFS